MPVDLLQIPKKASDRREAVEALRYCDQLCTLIDNQPHCIKNDKFVIVSVIEHVFTQVVPVPKARGINLNQKDLLKSKRKERRHNQRVSMIKKREAEATANANKSFSIKGNNIEDTEITIDEKRFFGGVEVLPDFTAGKNYESFVSLLPCMWDEPITHEMQVELLLILRRLTEQ